MRLKAIKSADGLTLSEVVNKYLSEGWTLHSTGFGATNSVGVFAVYLTKDDDV